MTEKQIINEFCNRMLHDASSDYFFPNIFLEGYECDILRLTASGYTHEYEIKITKSDFKADSKKKKMSGVSKYEDILSGRRINRFSYMVPEGLITVEDIPKFAGLIYVKESSVGYYTKERGHYSKPVFYFEVIKSAPQIHKNKSSERDLFHFIKSLYFRFHQQRRVIYTLGKIKK